MADEEDATIINTRTFVYLPARYVPLLLDPSGYMVRQVWERLNLAIINVNDLQACAPLIKWLHVASMGTQTVQGHPVPTMLAYDLRYR